MEQKKEFMTEIGVLWTRTSKDGKTKYMSGILKDLRGEIKIVCFLNSKKEKENQPDMKIYLQKEQDNAPRKSMASMPGADDAGFEAAGVATVEYPDDEINPADIQF